MDIEGSGSGKKGYMFHVEILIEAESNGVALEQLLHALNTAQVKDFQIKSGIEFGKIIEATLRAAGSKETGMTAAAIKGDELRKAGSPASQSAKAADASPSALGKEPTTKPPASSPTVSADTHRDREPAPPVKLDAVKETAFDILHNINDFIVKNTLIRLTILKGKGVKLSIPCRIVASDPATRTVTVYHVDEKKVYQFSLNEIDDFLIVG